MCLSEEVMLGSVVYGHEQMQTAIQAIAEFAAEAGVQAWEWQAPEADAGLADKVAAQASSAITEAYAIADKMDRQDRVSAIRDEVVAALVSDAEDSPSEEDVRGAVSKLEKSIVRGRIIAGEKRIDGRDTSTVRPITIRTGVLPRTHGSRCLLVAKPRHWSLPRWVPVVMHRSSMRLKAATKKTS